MYCLYSIEEYFDKFKTYKLIDGSNKTYFEVVPERGGIVTRFNYKGHDILYLDKETLYDKEKNIRGGIPILFPICGYLNNEKYMLNGTDYHMKQHGLARLYNWDVISKSTAQLASITLKFSSNYETKKFYPFDFDVIFTYSIKNNVLKIYQSYINKSDVDMIFYSGFHPYFYIKDKNNVNFNINSNKYYDTIYKAVQDFNGHFDFKREEINAIFAINSCTSSIIDKSRNLKISLTYDNVFKYIVVWSLKGKDFICLEPWMAKPNSMNSGEDLQIIKPKEKLNVQLNIEISNISAISL